MSTSLMQKLRSLRGQKGLSLDDLAKITDISKSYLWELENRDKRNPSAEKLSKIANALDVTINYLLDDNVNSPNSDTLREAFFRKYENLKEDEQKKILDIIKSWSKE